MICLHISATKDEDGIRLEVDRLEREDASKQEAQIIDGIHDRLKAVFEAQGFSARSEIKKPWWRTWK